MKSTYFKTKTSALLSLLTLTALIGCGSDTLENGCKGIVCGVEVSSFEQNGSTFAEFKAILNLGAVQFPAFNMPVKSPETQEELGVIWVGQNLNGQTEMGYRFDLSATDSGNHPVELNPTLPNGNPIPLVGLEQATTIAYTLNEKQIKIYASRGENIAMLGVAIPVSQLDETGANICPSALMPTFTSKKGIRGSGGVYFGCEAGKSGIALFIDVSAAMKKDPSLKAYLGLEDSNIESHIQFLDVKPKKSLEKKVEKALYKFHQKNKGKTVTIP